MNSLCRICAIIGIAILAAGCDRASPSRSEPSAESGRDAAQVNALPAKVVQALSRIDSAELISLEPWAAPKTPGDRVEGILVLGVTKLSTNDARAAGATITSAVASFDGMVAACFDPRHALRFKANGHTYIILVCFDCGSLRVVEDGQQIAEAALTGSPASLNRMLAAAKVPISRSAEELAAKLALEREANDRRWRTGMPASVRPVWSDQFIGFGDDLHRVRVALAIEFPKPKDRIRALLSWYGSGAGPWSGYPSHEAVAQELLFDFSTSEVIKAIQAGDVSEAQLEGASRFFADSNFGKQRPKDRARLPQYLRDRLLAHSLRSGDNDKVGRAKRAFSAPSA